MADPTQADQLHGRPVGANKAIAVEGQQSLAGAAQEARVRMQVHLLKAAIAPLEQASLDLARGPLQERQRIVMGDGDRRRQVDDARQGTARIDDRHRRATDVGVAVAEMLGTDDGQGEAFGKGRADGVGSHRLFRPVAAGAQADPLRFVAERVVAQANQHHPVWIGQHDHAAERLRLAAKRDDFTPRRNQQFLVSLSQLLEGRLREARLPSARRPVGKAVQAAAFPRAQDG